MKKLMMVALSAAFAGCMCKECKMSVSSAPFGETKYGEKATLYTLRARADLSWTSQMTVARSST